MRITNLRIIEKYLKKNRGNNKLRIEIDKLINTLKEANWSSQEDISKSRPDADRIHPDGFYFFNIYKDRTMILIEIEEKQASIVWCGNHDEYVSTFKNNKNTIRKWLHSKNWI